MEFKFNSMEERSSNYNASSSSNTNTNNFSNPSNIPYFAHQAIRAGYASPDLRRREIYRNPNLNLDFRDTIQRELEKERIRAEIIAEEVLKRRLLEDEVRREMMIEREMTMRRGGSGGGVGGQRESMFSSTMRFDHRVGVGVGVPLLTNFEHRGGLSPQREIGFYETRMMPFQRDPIVARNVDGSGMSLGVKLNEIKEIKGNVEGVNKGKVVFMAKPNATDLKRKATTPLLVASVDPSAGLKKPKTKDEWSCALCQISATSERALNDHLQGKKHKSRENGLNSQRTGFGIGPLPKIGSHGVAKPTKVPGASNSSSLKKDGVGASNSPSGKVDKSAIPEPLTFDQTSALMKEPETSVAKGKIGEASVPQMPASTKPKKKFRYFCEACQVGAYSLKVMNAHKKGKRHLATAIEPNKTDDISAHKSMVEIKKANEEPGIANSLEKGVVEKVNNMDISVANSSLEKDVNEEEKKKDTSVAHSSLEKGVDEEEKKNDTSAANSFLEKGVDEEEKRSDTSVANCSLVEGVDSSEKGMDSLEKGVDEEEKKNDTSVANSSILETGMDTSAANSSLEKSVDEENKGKDTSVANETSIESEEDKVGISKESDVCDMKDEEDNEKVLEICADFVSVEE